MDELERIKQMTPEEQQAYLENLQACEHDCSTCEAECSSRVTKPAKLVIVVTGGKGKAKDARRVVLDTWHHTGARELAARFGVKDPEPAS